MDAVTAREMLQRFRDEWASLDPANSDLSDKISAFRAKAEETGDQDLLNAALQLELSQTLDRRLWDLHNQMLWVIEALVVLAERTEALEARDT